MNDTALALEARGVVKSFNKVEVLHGVDFCVKKGEIHGLVGGNGAGKSTLMKIINGVYKPDSGEILINGVPMKSHTPREAQAAGISMVYQEFSLVSTMTVAQNLYLANEPIKGGLIDDKRIIKRAREVFKRLNVEIDPRASVGSLNVGNKQLVEIAKALMHQEPSIIILDEPTASLSKHEIDTLFNIMNELKKSGISIILVSHHLQEIMQMCDSATVLRDGKTVLSSSIADTTMEEIVAAIIGKKAAKNEYLPPAHPRSEVPLMTVENLKWKNVVNGVSFSLYGGEILGLAGMMGSGRTEIVNMLYGISKPTSGNIIFKDHKANIRHPADAIQAGIALVPEERHTNGLILGDTIRMNVLLPIWQRLSSFGWIRDKKGKIIVQNMIEHLHIKTTGMEQKVLNLSGGNQQKVVFAKSISSEPQVFLLDDPTMGVDIEFKSSIAKSIRSLADEGNAVLLISGELDEMARIADRILVIRQGKIVGEITRDSGREISEKTLVVASQGIN
jgi:ribose transport system ATP-binding protein